MSANYMIHIFTDARSSQNLMISETFLRMFVESVGHYSDHITTQQDGQKVFLVRFSMTVFGLNADVVNVSILISINLPSFIVYVKQRETKKLKF